MLTVAKMATFPGRADIAPKAFESIHKQVDLVTVYCNGYEKIPEFLVRKPNVQTIFGKDLGDGGKIFGSLGDYTFLVDDDIIYPPDYVARMIEEIDKDPTKVYGCHAAIMKNPVKNYFKDREVLHFRSPLSLSRRVNVLGTGTVAFKSGAVYPAQIKPEHPNMLDCYFAEHCQRNQIGMVSIQRPNNWLKSLPTETSLWQQRGNGELQTQVMQKIPHWSVY